MSTKPALLIVDDDPLIGESLSFVLSADFDVRVCPSRNVAMTLLKSNAFRPVLALIDLGLPFFFKMRGHLFIQVGDI